MDEAKALHQMNPQSRFSSRAEDYAKYRPSYSEDTINCIVADLDNVAELVAVDVGAGTGISSRLLADKGIKVLAVEPNAAMRQQAKEHYLVEFRDGSAENTGLADSSVDLVTCFQSFHWFDPEPTLKEFARILKPKGRLAAVWHNRDRTDEFTREYSILTKKASHNRSELRQGTERYLNNIAGFASVRHLVFPYQQALTCWGLVGRAMSTSYIPKEGAECDRIIRDLKQLHQKYTNHQGLVDLQYQTSVYLTQLLDF